MFDLAPELNGLYEQSLREIGEDDPYAGPQYLGIHDVLKAHFLIADYFYALGKGLGGIGPRSADLLHSALHRQHVSFGGKLKWSDNFQICSTLFFGIIKNHPFYDANKRTALLCLVYHLQCQGVWYTESEDELENLAVDVADDNLGRYRRYQDLSRDSSSKDDAAISFLAYHLKKNTRRIDKRHYTVTYRELRKLLNSFGYDLQNPKHNTIDLVRVEERRKIFRLFGGREQIGVKVCQVGFPSWTAQVQRGAMSTIRREARLTHKDGVDSQIFYRDADPISILISRYNSPLRRLADR